MASTVETAIRGAVGKGFEMMSALNRRRMKPAPNRFIEGEHAPLAGEASFDVLEVRGTIPPELDGLYVRNGPNPLHGVHGPSHHWFLGDAMVHGVRLAGGRAHWYRNRWVRSTAVSRALGEPPAPGPRHPRADTANTNVVGLGGRLFAIVEAGGNPVELTPDLETRAHNPFDGSLVSPFSAHPHRDPATGISHAICYEGAPDGNVWHVAVDAQGHVIRTEPIAIADGPSIHDCAITERHILVLDLPVTFSIDRFVRGFQFPMAWNPAHPARVGVLGLDAPGSSIRWCTVDPCYVFHPANAHETEDGRIICDLVVHDTMFASSTMGPDARHIALERWTVDPAAGTVSRSILDDAPQEFPRIDERLTGRPHRHIWTLPVRPETVDAGTALWWHDTEAGTRTAHDFGPGALPGEFVHVPRGPGELDAWLMGLVTWPAEDRSALVILDAARFDGPSVAEVHIPQRIPPGFHGNWVTDVA